MHSLSAINFVHGLLELVVIYIALGHSLWFNGLAYLHLALFNGVLTSDGKFRHDTAFKIWLKVFESFFVGLVRVD